MTTHRYDNGCRCLECKANHNQINKEYRQKRKKNGWLPKVSVKPQARLCHKCHKNTPGYKARYCSDCKILSLNEKREKAKLSERNKRLDPLYREKNRLSAARTRSKYPEKVKKNNLWINKRPHYLRKHYGITLDQFEAMIVRQNKACAICKRITEKWHVDHDHITGQVRGLLCAACNLALGLFNEDPNRIMSAMQYLGKYSITTRSLVRNVTGAAIRAYFASNDDIGFQIDQSA